MSRASPKHPYVGLPPRQYWSSAMRGLPPGMIDPVDTPSWRIDRNVRVATLGSCFAQHLSRFLGGQRDQLFLAEPPLPEHGPDLAASYRQFSARYGNVYTARQALQLFERAFAAEPSNDHAWALDDRFVDAFRPTVEPGGFATLPGLVADRAKHLAAVRELFTRAEVIVFTLGLTQAWFDTRDGAVFPIAPGVAGGAYDPAIHASVDFGYAEVRADLVHFLEHLRSVNAAVRVVLTVSPIPLAATFRDQHVLTSTTQSKAVLRAVAGEVSGLYDWVEYFPAFEIVTSPAARGRYFDADLRSVTSVGVGHVLRLFTRHYLSEEGAAAPGGEAAAPGIDAQSLDALSRVICDEERLG